jgi:hypothetical protein
MPDLATPIYTHRFSLNLHLLLDADFLIMSTALHSN